MGFIANCSIPASVSLNGIEKPVRRSRSRLPPVMLSTVSIMMSTPCVLRPLQHGAVEAAILVEIKLIDLRRVVRLAQLLEAHRAERGNAEHCAVFRSGSGDGAFTLMVEQTLQGGRRAIDRQGKLLAHDGDGEINGLDAAQDVGYEVTALEGLRIAPVGHLVVGGTVDVIEDRSGQPSLGEPPEIMKVVTIVQMHAARTPCGRIDQISRRRDLTRIRKRLDASMSESGTKPRWSNVRSTSAFRSEAEMLQTALIRRS